MSIRNIVSKIEKNKVQGFMESGNLTLANPKMQYLSQKFCKMNEDFAHAQQDVPVNFIPSPTIEKAIVQGFLYFGYDKKPALASANFGKTVKVMDDACQDLLNKNVQGQGDSPAFDKLGNFIAQFIQVLFLQRLPHLRVTYTPTEHSFIQHGAEQDSAEGDYPHKDSSEFDKLT